MNIECSNGVVDAIFLKNLLQTLTQGLVEYKEFSLILNCTDRKNPNKGKISYQITGYEGGAKKINNTYKFEEDGKALQETILSFFLDMGSSWYVTDLTLMLNANGVFIQTEKFEFTDNHVSFSNDGTVANTLRNICIYKKKVDQAEVLRFQDDLVAGYHQHVRIIGKERIQFFYGEVDNFDLRIEDIIVK